VALHDRKEAHQPSRHSSETDVYTGMSLLLNMSVVCGGYMKGRGGEEGHPNGLNNNYDNTKFVKCRNAARVADGTGSRAVNRKQ